MSKTAISQPTTPIDETLSWKIFTSFINDEQNNLTSDELYNYAINELKLPVVEMPPGLMEHLPVILLTFMQMWHGWRYKRTLLSGKMQKESYFRRFQVYVKHKMTNIINTHFAAALKELETPPKKDKEKLAPLTITLNCPLSTINRVTCATIADDVVVHLNENQTWGDIFPTIPKWPHVQIRFTTEDISFIRRDCTEYSRFLTFIPQPTPKQHKEDRIEWAKAFGTQECYSYDFLEQYCQVYFDMLLKNSKVPHSKFQEIELLLKEFLLDVKDIDVKNSIATNTAIRFRLGRNTYVRTQSIFNCDLSKNEPEGGLFEIITPKVDLALTYFRPKQLDTPHLSFEYTEKISNSEDMDVVIPAISYTCTFCDVEYTGRDSRDLILQHLQDYHKSEKPMRCANCRKEFSLFILEQTRWKHDCDV